MTRIKFCGLTRPGDILAANALKPEYIGFVFAPASRRYLPPEQAAALRQLLDPDIRAVGVFVDETPETVAGLLNRGVIHLAQLHGREDGAYLRRLRALTRRPVIQAFRSNRRRTWRRPGRAAPTLCCWTRAPGPGPGLTGACSGISGGPTFSPAG